MAIDDEPTATTVIPAFPLAAPSVTLPVSAPTGVNDRSGTVAVSDARCTLATNVVSRVDCALAMTTYSPARRSEKRKSPEGDVTALAALGPETVTRMPELSVSP